MIFLIWMHAFNGRDKLFVCLVEVGKDIIIGAPFLQTLTFKTPEPRQFPLGIQKPALSEVLANISAGTLYLKAGSPWTLSKSLKVIYTDLLGSKDKKSTWVPISMVCLNQ